MGEGGLSGHFCERDRGRKRDVLPDVEAGIRKREMNLVYGAGGEIRVRL